MRTVSALVAAALILALPAAAPADSSWMQGIHWYGDHTQNDVEAMTGGKGVWDLETVNLYDGGWTMNDQAAKFQAVVNKGHTIVIRIQPRWGWAIPAPAERAQYLNDVEAAANQAKNWCHIWQVGNEMNLYGEYGGGVLTAAEYIAFYKQVRERIRRVSSPLGPQRVLVGPVSPGDFIGEVRHTDGFLYLSQMCDGLTQNDTDGFALHAYGAHWKDAAGALADFQFNYRSQLHKIDDKGFHNKPAYILEWNRQTNPITDAAQEQQSAIFLNNAFQDLKNWNNNTGNHPIVCAAWFIYPDFAGWESFSIRKLRDYGSRGVNLDLWDTFQNSCGQNIAAGSQTPRSAVVLDNTQATYVGSWSTATSAADKYNGDYRYKTQGTGTSYVEYRPNLSGGTVQVYAWWPQGTNRTASAEYKITHASGTATVLANQQANGGRWNLLGSYTFNPGTTGYVRVSDKFPDAGKVVMADAVKFITVAPLEIIVDNSNAGFTASANWATGTSAVDKYGTNYRFHGTQAVSDAATWNFTVSQTRNHEVYAWWSASTNRAAAAPYVVQHSAGSATVNKNQQVNGGSWQSLGTWNLAAGANWVKLSCWTTTGYAVIADAIKVVPR